MEGIAALATLREVLTFLSTWQGQFGLRHSSHRASHVKPHQSTHIQIKAVHCCGVLSLLQWEAQDTVDPAQHSDQLST